MVKLVNTIGKEFIFPVETEEVTKLAGDSNVTFEIVENEYNRDIVNAISKMWIVKNVAGEYDPREYVIKILHKGSVGNKSSIKIIAISKHINDLKRMRIIENLTGSFTADEYFKIIFKDTGYTYKIIGKFYSSRFENAGDGNTRLNMFNEGLKHYNAEFEYNALDKQFIIKAYISHKADYYISDFVNATNFNLEEDATEFCTFCRGFGDFDDGDKFQDARLKVEYRHPLADVIGVYEAAPIKDGRIKKIDELKARVEDTVIQSLKVSLTLDFITLQNEFPEAVARIGDYIPVKGQVIDVFDYVRIVEVKTTRNAAGKIIKQPLTLGDYKKRDRYTRAVSKATSYVNNVTSRVMLSADNTQARIDTASRLTTNLLDFSNALNASSRGLRSVDGLKIVDIMARDGIRTSNDGGSTYIDVITGDGINPDAIPLATSTQNGLLSKEDKAKLDALFNGDLVLNNSNTSKDNADANVSDNLLGSKFYIALNGGTEPTEKDNIIGGINSNDFMEV